ncbi:MAG: NTP transferase domain-containing protein, partial [Proteobacteria bacterium]|nr:NTP transferase domain-containing protein [Pseudomonadota bacterium]
MIVPVILAGGTGTRLWPLSRSLYPKQLLALVSDNTMLQDTIQRVQGDSLIAEPIVICNSDQRFMVAEQLEDIKVNARIILEPVGRNTAPAVAVAALEAMSDGEDPVLLVLPADHVVLDSETFRATFKQGEKYAADGALITFGITPTAPETGFGYIKKDLSLKTASDPGDAIYPVASFVEKPDLKTAKGYVAGGEYLWNSGMFMFKASRYLEELEKFAPEMLASVRDSYDKKVTDLDFIRLDAEAFAQCPSDSIDYAVME